MIYNAAELMLTRITHKIKEIKTDSRTNNKINAREPFRIQFVITICQISETFINNQYTCIEVKYFLTC